MIILIDAGNTRIKFGSIQPGSGHRETQALALPHAELEQVDAWLRQLPAVPTGAIGVNVAGAAMAGRLQAHMAKYIPAIDWVGSQASALDVHNHYRQPGQLGPDRWVALLGLAQHMRTAHPSSPSPAILASFGTATTIDTLVPQEAGNPPPEAASANSIPPAPNASPSHGRRYTFRGGLILPGPALMNASLAQATAHLPEAQGATADFPTDTHQAIVTGIAAAQAGAILRQWLAGLDSCGAAPRLYVSGGGWPIVKDEIQRLLDAAQARLGIPGFPIEWLANPVLDGLASLARFAPNCGNQPQKE